MNRQFMTLLASVLLATGSHGQSDTAAMLPGDISARDRASACDGEYVLELSHINGKKTKTIRTGRKIRLWSGEKMLKAKIVRIAPDSVYLAATGVPIAEIDRIRVNLKGFLYGGGATIAGGAVITGLGLFTLAAGSAAINSQDSEDDFAGFLLALAGVGIAGTGCIVMMVGVPMLLAGKNYDMHKKWSVKSVPVPRTGPGARQ